MKLYAQRILLADGWHKNQTLTIDNGIISEIESGNVNADVDVGTVIPGMVNCHSHAFQRAFAGFSEQGSEGQDSFWTWRTIMYKFLRQLTVEHAQIIATQLYIEMLKMGYTRVAEFHYLHHALDGNNHDDLSAMAKAIFEAGDTSGIGLTLLPVLYRFSGFGPLPATEGQKRFINTTEQFNQLVTECVQLSQNYRNTNVGIAPHSLRAVDLPSLNSAVNHIRGIDECAPIHIHIAEQQKEVDDCLAHYGKRPVQWLLDNFTLDPHWCLIHATHINEAERQGLAQSGAIAGICPTTEANLGDGVFPTAEYLAEKGNFAIGSDSHISVDPIEELRWLEYAQRLTKQQRAVLADTNTLSVGKNLWQRAARGGALSTHSNTGELAIGKQADLLVLDEDKLKLFAHSEQHLLDSVVFASQSNLVADVMVNGQWVVQAGKHVHENQSAEQFSELLSQLSA
ncbi:formimidoylglutamate deiminase [Thalassotalea sp. G2M2-11]|uniref:formimidoylglutamate deiminase n=1 Tax=Thalassotalea sp. G2M2-11 TaxID=2787627 RepID=UPI0019D01CE1|nr:formimidoylglutamate deiminase [Thalassotalea sp. G2M2-11]